MTPPAASFPSSVAFRSPRTGLPELPNPNLEPPWAIDVVALDELQTYNGRRQRGRIDLPFRARVARHQQSLLLLVVRARMDSEGCNDTTMLRRPQPRGGSIGKFV